MTDTILTDADYRAINTALGHIVATREQLQKAQRAGLDMDEPLAILDLEQAKLEAIKREFFPTRP